MKNEKINYILSGDNSSRFDALEIQIGQKKSKSPIGNVTKEEVNHFDEPQNLQENIRFNYTFCELKKIAELYGFNESKEKFNTFLLQAIQYCGIRIGDEAALQYVKTISGFPKKFRYFRIAGLWGTTRLTIRIVPDQWTGRFTSNFVLKGSEMWIDDYFIGELKAIFTGSSLYNLAYVTENQNSEKILSINPLQKCEQNCQFCFKGSRAMLSSFRDTLINLKADEMLRFLQVEYPELDYSELTELVVLTARFRDTDQLISYISEIYRGICKISNGGFDPLTHSNQRIKVSTHLLSDLDSMKRIFQVGVRRYIYPIEIFSNKLRRKYMVSPFYEKGSNKGDVSIEEIYKSLNIATSIFGIENIEPVIILGIDTYKNTKKGITTLKSIGLKLLTHNTFRVYDSDQMEMYHMSFEELVDIQQFLLDNFEANFSQKITSNLPKYFNKYQDIKG